MYGEEATMSGSRACSGGSAHRVCHCTLLLFVVCVGSVFSTAFSSHHSAGADIVHCNKATKPTDKGLYAKQS